MIDCTHFYDMHIKVSVYIIHPNCGLPFESSEICPSRHASVPSSLRHIKCRNSNNVNLGFVFFKCDALSVTILAVAKTGPLLILTMMGARFRTLEGKKRSCKT